MHVDDPAPEATDELGPEQLHESGQHNQVDRALVDPVGQRPIAAMTVPLGREHGRLHARALGARQAARVGPARGDADHLDAVAPVDRVQDRLEVRPLAGDQDSDPEGHRSTG